MCSQHSGRLETGGQRVTCAIKKDTTPDQFDNIIAGIANYRLEHGGRCGWNALGAASIQGNPELIRHIVQIGGNQLLSLGNSFGWTPLYCAANCEETEDGFLAAKELIRLGANLNLATSMCCGDSSKGDTLRGATPHWAAAEKTQNLKLVKLLLKLGAVVPPDLSEEGQEIINAVQRKIQQEREAKRLFLASYFKPENNESITQVLPYELVRDIFEFISYDPEFAIN